MANPFMFFEDPESTIKYNNFTMRQRNFFTRQLLKCIKKNKNSDDNNFILIIPIMFAVNNSIDSSRNDSHANMLIYRHSTSTLEHFEPHGANFLGKHITFAPLLYKTLREIVNSMNMYNNIKKKQFYTNNITYIEPSKVCPFITGFQFIEGSVFNNLPLDIKKKEGGGFCIMWSIFFAEIVLLNPLYSSHDLLFAIISWINLKPENGMYLRNVIRGYVHTCFVEVDNVLKKKINIDIAEAQSKKYSGADINLNILQMYIFDEFEEINQKSFNRYDSVNPSISIKVPEIHMSV